MIDFPARMAIDEVDIRLKEWKLLGLHAEWVSAGNIRIFLDESKHTCLVRYKSGKNHYHRVWKMAKKRLKKLLKDHT